MSALRTLWKFSAGLFAGIVILLALLIGLFRLLLPLAPEFHGDIESAASRFLNARVSIDRLDARWRFGGPELVIEGARIFADNGDTLLEVGHGSVGISVLRWIRTRELRPERVTLDGVTIDIVRHANGRFAVLGTELAGQGGGTLPTGRFELTDATVVFRDQATGVLPRVFSQVDLNLEIDAAGLRIDGSVALPPDLGKGLVLSAEIDGDLSTIAESHWQAYVSGEQVLLPGWASFLPESQSWFTSGGGDIEGWVGYHGMRLEQASLRVDLAQLAVADPASGDEAEYRRLVGRGEWNLSSRGWEVAAHDLIIDRGEHGWQSSLMRAELASADADATQVFYASTDVVRVDDLFPLAALVLPDELRERIAKAAVHGEFTDVELRLARSQGALSSYYAHAQFAGFGIAASESLPGVDGLNGELRLDSAGGSVHLTTGAARIDLRTMLREPLDFDAFGGTVIWRSSPGSVRVVSDSIIARNDDLSAVASVEFTVPTGDGAPVLDLRVDLTGVDLSRAKNYLPAGVMTPKLVDWLDNAIQDGRAPSASVKFRGPLDQFPFDDDNGSFVARLALDSVDLQFNQGWPVLAGITGDVVFEGLSLSADVTSGTIAGNRVRRGQVRIPDLRQAVIDIDASADSGIVPTLDFLRTSPIGALLGDSLERLSGDGDGDLAVRLSLPLADIANRKVVVDLDVGDARFAIDGFPQPLEQIRGRVSYRDGALSAGDVEAVFLGRPVFVSVASERRDPPVAKTEPTATLLGIEGTFSASDLANGLLAPLAAVFAGETQLRGVVRLPPASAREKITVEVTSTLAGMAMTLPAPLAKPAADSAVALVRLTLIDPELMDLEVSVDSARAFVELRDDGSSWRAHRGQISFGGDDPQRGNEDGIAIRGLVGNVDVGGWLAFDPGIDNPRPLQSTLRSMHISAEELDLFGQTVSDAVVSVDRNQREWLVQLSSDAAEGVFFVPFDIGPATPIVANLEHLRLDGGDAGSDAEPNDPRKIPPVIIDVTDFTFDDMQLGVMHAELRQTERGVHLEAFDTEAPSFQVSGGGDWFLTGTQHRSVVDLSLISTDLEVTLKALAFEGSVAADEANITMALNWPGPPDGNFRNQLNGEVAVNVGQGKLVGVQPGAGRVFGLLSVAALPRRLSLDFRDVFDSGFGFDFIRGDFSLRDGNAYTSNLVLEGPAAQVGIVGRAGLVARDYDQTAVVYANFGATLPVAGAVVGGPAVGAALLVFSEIFKRPLQEMARVNYRITGSWEEPEVERVVESELARGDSAGAP